MIRYDLKCDMGHAFDSWFAGASAFDRLLTSGHVSCPDCGSLKVEKALMAPAVTKATAAKPLSVPSTSREQALAELRRQVETKSEYVGLSFSSEARAMHEGTSPERPIHGEAKLEEAKKLIEEGIPVVPLPFIPTKNTN